MNCLLQGRGLPNHRPIDFNYHFVPATQYVQQHLDARKTRIETRGKYARPVPQLTPNSTVQSRSQNQLKRPISAVSGLRVKPQQTEEKSPPKQGILKQSPPNRLERAKSAAKPCLFKQASDQPSLANTSVMSQSKSSWSSKHSQYIRDLEHRLRKERMRRITAEEALIRLS